MNDSEIRIKEIILASRLRVLSRKVSELRNSSLPVSSEQQARMKNELKQLEEESIVLKTMKDSNNNNKRKTAANKFLDRLTSSNDVSTPKTDSESVRRERQEEKDRISKKNKEERTAKYRKMRNEQLLQANRAAEEERKQSSKPPADMSDFGILHIPLSVLMEQDFPYPCFETQTPPVFIKSLVGTLGDTITIEGQDVIGSSSSKYDTLGLFKTTCTARTSALECNPTIVLKNSLNNNRDELCWTIAHELGHFISHNKRHFNKEPHLGKMLEEGFAEVFAMFALPKHPKAHLIYNRAQNLESSESYLDLLRNKWRTEEDKFHESYELLPAYMYKYVEQKGIETLDELISHLYRHRLV